MELCAGEELLGTVEIAGPDTRAEGIVDIPAVRDPQDRGRLLWSPSPVVTGRWAEPGSGPVRFSRSGTP